MTYDNQDSIYHYVSKAIELHPEASTYWMGGYLGTCVLNDEPREVIFSNYGGFFYDLKTRTYYQLPADMIESWLAYLQGEYLALAKRVN